MAFHPQFPVPKISSLKIMEDKDELFTNATPSTELIPEFPIKESAQNRPKQPKTTTFTWELASFAALSQTRYDSPLFGFSEEKIPFDTKFFLAAHPQGAPSFWNKSHALVYLFIKWSDRDAITVKYRLSIQDARGVKRNTQEGKTKFIKLPKSWTMEYNWQYNVRRDWLLNPGNRLLNAQGALTLVCEVSVVEEEPPFVIPDTLTVKQLSSDLNQLHIDEQLSDVCLVVSGTDLPAHKAILAARSPVFAAMFAHTQTKESLESRVEISDISLEVFQHFLDFLYSGRLPQLEEWAFELMVVADKYQIECLKTICEQYLINSISIESVAHLCLLAHMHEAGRLEARCIEYIVSFPNQVMATEGWKVLAERRPELGLRLFQRLASKTT